MPPGKPSVFWRSANQLGAADDTLKNMPAGFFTRPSTPFGRGSAPYRPSVMSTTQAQDEVTMHLTYYAQHRALICRACKYALNPGASVAKHL